jgi:hypothetical protein
MIDTLVLGMIVNLDANYPYSFNTRHSHGSATLHNQEILL